MSHAHGDGLLGLFREPDAAAQAMDALRGIGFGEDDLTVLTDAPYPEGAFGEEPPRHRVYVFPLVGAALGVAVGLLVTIGTQLSYPLVTGGKPILSIPPMINIIYEGMMLGAILFAFFGILHESRLPDFGGLPYDARVSEGYLGVLVSGAGARREAAERALLAAGAEEVVQGGEHVRRVRVAPEAERERDPAVAEERRVHVRPR